jgi:hypothetical protein
MVVQPLSHPASLAFTPRSQGRVQLFRVGLRFLRIGMTPEYEIHGVAGLPCVAPERAEWPFQRCAAL